MVLLERLLAVCVVFDFSYESAADIFVITNNDTADQFVVSKNDGLVIFQ
jgi:hypothetical protein